MTLQQKKYLFDILTAIEPLIEISTQAASYEAYQNNVFLKAAAERFLSIIGEAATKYQKLNPQHKLIHGDRMINFRNRLVHAYDNIDDRIMWTILQNHILPLKSEVKKLLDV